MSWKAKFKVVNDPKFYSNGVTLSTKAEAEAYAKDKFANWTMSTDWLVEESEEVPNYIFQSGYLEPIKGS